MEETLELRRDVTAKFSGLVINIDDSKAHIIYRPKNVNAAFDEDGNLEQLQLLTVASSELEKALEMIKVRAAVNEPNYEQIVFLSQNEFIPYKKKQLDLGKLKMKPVHKYESVVKAFMYQIKTLPRKKFFQDFLYEAVREEINIAPLYIGMLKSMLGNVEKATSNTTSGNAAQDVSGQVVSESELPVLESEENIFPCLLVNVDSRVTYLQINSDGFYRFLDSAGFGSESVIGLGSLLTGCKTEEDFLELASRGNQKNVHVYGADLAEDNDVNRSNFYSLLSKADVGLMYCFGKCVNRQLGDFSAADLAAANLTTLMNDVAYAATNYVRLLNISRVCFTGPFVQHRVVRHSLTNRMCLRNFMFAASEKPTVKFDFVKSGAYLGALGVLLTECQN